MTDERIPLTPTDEAGGAGSATYSATTTRSGQEMCSSGHQHGVHGGGGASAARRAREQKVLLGALVFCLVFMILELVAGTIAHSLALITDAVHLLTDVGAYALSIAALIAAGRAACGRYTYGWHRAEVIGTLGSVFLIWVLVGWIVLAAVTRIVNIVQCSHEGAAGGGGGKVKKVPHAMSGENDLHCNGIDSTMMMTVGTLGVAVNVICAAILYFGGSHGHSHGGHGHSHGGHADTDHGHCHSSSNNDGNTNSSGGENTRFGFAIHAALLHALGDCVQSVAVVLSGVFIYVANRTAFGEPVYAYSIYNLADPLVSIFFAVVTLNMTKSLLFDLLGILMESTPPNFDTEALEEELRNIPGVVSVHDLHVWSLSAEYIALSVHLVADDANAALKAAQELCVHQFSLTHTTIQVDSVADGQCYGSCR